MWQPASVQPDGSRGYVWDCTQILGQQPLARSPSLPYYDKSLLNHKCTLCLKRCYQNSTILPHLTDTSYVSLGLVSPFYPTSKHRFCFFFFSFLTTEVWIVFINFENGYTVWLKSSSENSYKCLKIPVAVRVHV